MSTTFFPEYDRPLTPACVMSKLHSSHSKGTDAARSYYFCSANSKDSGQGSSIILVDLAGPVLQVEHEAPIPFCGEKLEDWFIDKYLPVLPHHMIKAIYERIAGKYMEKRLAGQP